MILHHYQSNSGKDLILDYIKSLPDDEQTDGFSVLECLEKGKMEKICICSMLAGSRKIKQKREIRI